MYVPGHGTRPRHRARSLRHSRAQTRESTPPRGETSRCRLASSTTGGGLRRGERIRTGTRNPPPPSGAQPSSFSCADTGIHAPSRRDLAPRRAPPHRDTRPFPHCPYPPTMPVLNLSKGPPKTLASCAPVRRPDLRVNVAKCRRMSHYFAPPLVNPCNLRVENLTIWSNSRPFWPISVHFRVQTSRPSPACRCCLASTATGQGLRRGERGALGPRHS